MLDWIERLTTNQLTVIGLVIALLAIIIPVFKRDKSQSNTNNVSVDITFDQYSEKLEQKEQEIRSLLMDNVSSQHEKNSLRQQLAVIEKLSIDKQASYEAYIKDLQQRIERLSAFTGKIPQTLLDDALTALKKDETKQADQLLEQVEQQAQDHIDAAAEAAYQRAKITEDNLEYTGALQHAQRAVRLAPDKGHYYNFAGLLANTLADYGQAIEYYEQALESNLKTFDEDHPDVATVRNNLGGVWPQGRGRGILLRVRNNLGGVWQAKGELGKAIAYYEQALASLLITFDTDHPTVVTVRNNLASAIKQQQKQ